MGNRAGSSPALGTKPDFSVFFSEFGFFMPSKSFVISNIQPNTEFKIGAFDNALFLNRRPFLKTTSLIVLLENPENNVLKLALTGRFRFNMG